MTDRAGDDALEHDADAVQHDWWDPGEKYPRLRAWSSDGGVLLSCRLCGRVRRKDGRPDSSCPGLVKVELR